MCALPVVKRTSNGSYPRFLVDQAIPEVVQIVRFQQDALLQAIFPELLRLVGSREL